MRSINSWSRRPSTTYVGRSTTAEPTTAVGLSIAMICIDIMNIFAGPTTLSEPVLHPLLCLECFAGRRQFLTPRPVGVIADPTTLAGEQPDSSSASTSPAIHPTTIVGVGCSQSYLPSSLAQMLSRVSSSRHCAAAPASNPSLRPIVGLAPHQSLPGGAALTSIFAPFHDGQAERPS